MRLLTFGDSWSYGVGAGYQESWTQEYYHNHKSDKEIANKYAFRSILAKELDVESQVDFSRPGGANDTQFRRFFTNYYGQGRVGDMNLALEPEDFVLWGITSLYRFEFWENETNGTKIFTIPREGNLFTEMYAVDYFDINYEKYKCYYNMKHVETICNTVGCKLLWYNFFNDHNFDIDNMLWNGSSVLSQMVQDNDPNDKYHMSTWDDTDRKIKRAKELKLCNPFSGHPTIEGHKQIANILLGELK